MHITGTHKPFIAAKMVPLLLMLVLILSAGLVTVHGQDPINSIPVSMYSYLDGACEMPLNGSAYTGTAVISYNVYTSNPPPGTNTAVKCSITLPTNFPAV